MFGGRGGFGGTGLAIEKRSFLRFLIHAVMIPMTAATSVLAATWSRIGALRRPRVDGEVAVLSEVRATLTRVDRDTEEAERIA